MRLTEEDIKVIGMQTDEMNYSPHGERNFMWVYCFARRIERAVLEKVANFLQMKADIALSRGFESHAEFMRPAISHIRSAAKDSDAHD